MKKALFIACLLQFFQTAVWAQVPQAVNYQAIARNPQGQPEANKNISLRLSVLQDNPFGASIYVEKHSATTNNFGLFTVPFGQGQSILGDFAQIKWGENKHFIKVEADFNGGTTFMQLGDPVPLLSVPYALYSERAKFADNAVPVVLTGGPGITISNNVISAADNSASNELQTLSISGNTLILSNSGGTVTLPGATNYWTKTGNEIQNNNTGSVKIGNGIPNLTDLIVNNSARFGSMTGFNGVSIDGDETSPTQTFRAIDKLMLIQSASSTGGFLTAFGPFGNSRIQLSTLSGHLNNGFLAINDSITNPSGNNASADLGLYIDQNGHPSVQMGKHGDWKCGFYFDKSTGKYTMYAEAKTFRVSHPTLPNKDIVYNVLEGPEAAMYARGTAQLVKGKMTVELPDHFRALAAEGSLTVILTPLSADSHGLAVVSKGKTQFSVAELAQGTGNYGFDWEVKAVRSGFENYQPVQDKIKGAIISDDRKTTQTRHEK